MVSLGECLEPKEYEQYLKKKKFKLSKLNAKTVN